jgi:hypothetical protein
MGQVEAGFRASRMIRVTYLTLLLNRSTVAQVEGGPCR